MYIYVHTEREEERKKCIDAIKGKNFILKGLGEKYRFSFSLLSVAQKFIFNYSDLGINPICFLVSSYFKLLRKK